MRPTFAVVMRIALLVWLAPAIALPFTKQELVDTVTQAAHAYWDQRVVIEHPDGTFYGYSGEQTVVGPNEPTNRFYSSDGGYVAQPHIFIEHENSRGHTAAAIGFLRGYKATGNKFLKRVAKSLGDTLLSAQRDNDCGGWWYDMGVLGYDREEDSPTYRQILDYEHWVNYIGHAGVGKVFKDNQDMATFDGVSYLPASYLLRLYQALPAGEPGRDSYLEGAKLLADTIVGFKDVVDADAGFKPYRDGGIPQEFPYNRIRSRGMFQERMRPDYPYAISHGLMPTLNDRATLGAVHFLIEFWNEAKTNPLLDEAKYLEAIRLNVDYLLNVFDRNAIPESYNTQGSDPAQGPSTRGSWSSQYWINDTMPDGSRYDWGTVAEEPEPGQPTWGRAMECPGFGFFSEFADATVVKWWTLETDAVRKERIESALTRYLLYWRYNAPPVNSKPEWVAILRGDPTNGVPRCPYWKDSYDVYDPNDIDTWYWWLWYNHDASASALNVPVSSSQFITASNPRMYVVYYGGDALEYGHYNRTAYPMIRDYVARVIKVCLVESGGTASVDLLHGTGDSHDRQIERYFTLDTTTLFFAEWGLSASYLNRAMDQFDPTTGLFDVEQQSIFGQSFTVVDDDKFCRHMYQLSGAIESDASSLTDSDGDGYSDSEETTAGTDVRDSESYPGSGGVTRRPAPPSNLRVVPRN